MLELVTYKNKGGRAGPSVWLGACNKTEAEQRGAQNYTLGTYVMKRLAANAAERRRERVARRTNERGRPDGALVLDDREARRGIVVQPVFISGLARAQDHLRRPKGE